LYDNKKKKQVKAFFNSPNNKHAGYKRRETKAERLAKRKARREGKN